MTIYSEGRKGGAFLSSVLMVKPFLSVHLHESPATSHQSRLFPCNFKLSTFDSLPPPPVSRLGFSPATFNFQPSALSPPNRRALLHFRSQSILSFLTEDSDANRCGREVVHRWNYFYNYFLRFDERAAVRTKILFRNALALHRPVPRRPHRGHLRRAAPAECFLHGRRQRRRLENHRFRKHLESDLRRQIGRAHV